MSTEQERKEEAALKEAVFQLQQATAAKKCWTCGCLHSSLTAIERAVPSGQRPKDLDEAIRSAREHLAEVEYECLGCQVCYPALAVNALAHAGVDHTVGLATCPTEKLEERKGWPPLSGTYTVLRYRASVAVCTLTDDGLHKTIAQQSDADVTIVGTLQTENLGIERLILNIVFNPNIRFLVVCGADSRQAIGHLPGQSLMALARSGTDDRSRIVGTNGKRPFLRNISREAVEHFRRTVEVVDLVDSTQVTAVMDAVRGCAARDPGPAEPFAAEQMILPIKGYLPQRMVSDPEGYFVVYVDRARRLISLEHYRQDGVLDVMVEGSTAVELCTPVIDKGLISRLDHAAYLGRELDRAEQALLSGGTYVQDAAPERGDLVPINEDCSCLPSGSR